MAVVPESHPGYLVILFWGSFMWAWHSDWYTYFVCTSWTF